mmetsp:Transcript_10304/g.24724  ORF Transcript_10304/g.24724 Transcript_10304/m.24724 type:complete len:127 (-) Transcript_10304:326-706(-)
MKTHQRRIVETATTKKLSNDRKLESPGQLGEFDYAQRQLKKGGHSGNANGKKTHSPTPAPVREQSPVTTAPVVTVTTAAATSSNGSSKKIGPGIDPADFGEVVLHAQHDCTMDTGRLWRSDPQVNN